MIPNRFSSWFRASALLAALLCPIGHVSAQDTLNDQLRKVLTDPDAMKEMEKTKNLAPIEMFKTQVLPNDVLPYLKPNHWGVLATEMRSNQMDYEGDLQTSPILLEGMPHEMLFHREVRLPKGKRTRATFPIMVPRIPKEIQLELSRPDAIRPDEIWTVPLNVLEPHQMLVMVLTRGPNSAYGNFNKMAINAPRSASADEIATYARQRYYRWLLPEDPAQPQLPTHPLAWTMISHVIWDGMAPEVLSVGQQEAMLDWLHWGGQLIVVGGAGPSFAPLAESFLGPYLPGAANGNNQLLTAEDLAPLARKYHASEVFRNPEDLLEDTQSYESVWKKYGRRYQATPSPLRIEPTKPLYLTGMTPKPGASTISVGRRDYPPLAVEARVGRGRIIMVGVNIVEPSLLAWPGYETFVRRVLFRRIEDPREAELGYAQNGGGFSPPRYGFLNGPDVTWLRYHGRDLGAPTRKLDEEDMSGGTGVAGRFSARPIGGKSIFYNPIDEYQVPVAEWIDAAALPSLSRKTLEQASGIEIPNASFVLKVILAYVICLVPVNWLLCRYGLGRREWAWLLIPLMALGFAIVVERAAAYDVGYDSTCDEIDLLETHGDYGRGHLSRFGALYTTGRVKYSVTFPEDPTALVLPMSTGRALRGEDVRQSRFQTTPNPSMTDYLIQPRSLSMFRAEQMATVPGSVRLTAKDGVRTVVNDGPVEVKDAVFIEMKRGFSNVHKLGTIKPGVSVVVDGEAVQAKGYEFENIPALGDKGSLSPKPFLDLLVQSSISTRPEEHGEGRVVGWVDKVLPGRTIEPEVDRVRGFTLFVAHVKPPDVPDPDSVEYDALAAGPERLPAVLPRPNLPQNFGFGMMGPRRGGGPATSVLIPGQAVQKTLRPPAGAMPIPTPIPAPTPGTPGALPGAPPDAPDDPIDETNPEQPRP